MSSKQDLIILTPVFNDWASLSLLAHRIDELMGEHKVRYKIVAINDGSSIPMNTNDFSLIKELEILNLSRNLGHQKAIAIGLAFVNAEKTYDSIIVMDSDGEDRPEDIINLIKESKKNPQSIIFAKRVKRKEKPSFKVFYFLYKFFFKMLTGKKVDFGNFSIIPGSLVENVVSISEIWNHYSSAIMASRIPYQSIPIERGSRLVGVSKMNFFDLFLHGLSAISVQANAVSVRFLIASLISMGLCLIGILIAIYFRVFTDLAIPGWLTNVMVGLTLMVIQIFSVSVLLIFVILNNRTQRLFIPKIDYKPYVKSYEANSDV